MARPRKTISNVATQQITAAQTNQPNKKIKVLFFSVCKTSISDKYLTQVKNQVTGKDDSLLFLVIHTYGGDAYSAVRIVRILQKTFKKISVIIPDMAISAGTLMSLGGDEIWMDQESRLGPLDLPIEHPSDGSRISSLDVTNTLSNIASFYTSTSLNLFNKISNDIGLKKSEAAKLAFESALGIIEPVTRQIDPYHLQKSFREIKIAYFYAIDLLSSRMMKGDFAQAVKTSRSLVNDFPAHEYAIFRDEAKDSLKLNISHIENLQEWGMIKPEFDKLISLKQDVVILREL